MSGPIEFRQVAPAYVVRDVEEAVSWYRDHLGFEIEHLNRDPAGEDPTNYAVLRRDDVEFHLVLESMVDASAGSSGCQISVRNVDALAAQLEAGGVQIVRSLQDQKWGARDLVIADPDGNRLVLSEPGVDA